jgi:hypothetical protein
LGRFISRDPLGENAGTNLYSYVLNNPISLFDPLGLDVNGVYDRATHTLTLTDTQTGATVTTSNMFSGNGDTANDPAKQYFSTESGYPSDGPLPAGTYLIGTVHYVGTEHVPVGGDNTWFPLYGPNGKGGYSYSSIPVIDPTDGKIVMRGGFNLHTGRASDGCLTVWSDVPRGTYGYPHSTDFDHLRQLLLNTSTFSYKTGKFTGTVTVR